MYLVKSLGFTVKILIGKIPAVPRESRYQAGAVGIQQLEVPWLVSSEMPD
jgi:hypothetical protein